MAKLNMETVIVEGDIFAALKALSDIDNDFNGNNGEEYLSPEAKEAGCESNQEYLLNTLEQRKAEGEFNEEYEIVDAFCEAWCGSDGYYEEYEVASHLSEEGKVLFIALSYIQRD